MNYLGMPAFMWLIHKKSFSSHLVSDLGFDIENSKRITVRAKPKYREIIEKLPNFEKEDRFQTNIVNCAMLIAFLQSMGRRPSLDELTEYYANAMSTWATQAFCRVAGRNKFTKKDIDGMKKTAALMAADRNPYSWNMD